MVADLAVATLLAAVPVTVTVRSASFVMLSTAVMVTVSLSLAVWPAGMVMVVSVPTV